MKTLLLALALCQVTPADREPRVRQEIEEEARHVDDQHVAADVHQLIDSMRELGPWDEQYGYIVNAVESVYARNGWESEPDLFSLDLMREVSAIPPWQMRERFDTLTQMLSDRYLLDEDQQRTLRWTLARESFAMFARHAPRIMEYSLEAIKTRAAGEAITPEQVARWTELADPIYRDMRKDTLRIAQDFKTHLDDEQQALVDIDLAAALKRLDRVDQMRPAWLRGEWRPEEWGLDNDPIQVAAEARAAGLDSAEFGGDETLAARDQMAGAASDDARGSSPAGSPGVAPPSRRRVQPANRVGGGARGGEESGPRSRATASRPAVDDDPWATYIREFIARFELNHAQQQSAWRVHGKMTPRRDRLRERYGEQIGALERRLAAADSAGTRETIARQRTNLEEGETRLFEELKRRLDQLPTRAQRRAAAARAPASQPVASSDPHPHDGP